MDKVSDAVILAGGIGSRMLPASLYMPKETMPLVDTPILNHLVWEASRAGASRIHIVVSERKKNILSDFFLNGSIHDAGVRSDLPRESLYLGAEGAEIIPHLQPSAGGVADAIASAIDRIDGPFLVLLGDMVILDRHLGPKYSGAEHASNASFKLVSEFESNGLPCVGVCLVDPVEVSNYGVVELKDDMIVGIAEKPTESQAPSRHVLCGRYLLPARTKEILEEYPLSTFGELQSIQLLNHLIDNGGLKAVKLDQMKMYDSGDPVTWLKSQVDHALNREDIGEDLAHWIRKRIDG